MIDTTKKIKKITGWIFIFSLTSLLLVSILPWISVSETNSTEGGLYFNSIMMERSDNEQITGIANDLNFISDLLWITIFLSLIALIGFIINLTEKHLRLGQITTYIGALIIIPVILSINFQLALIEKINQMDTIRLASAVSIVEYAYIPLIFGFLLLILSGIYSARIVFFFVKKLRLKMKEKKQIDEKQIALASEKIQEKKPHIKKVPLNYNDFKKNLEIGDWSKEKDLQKIGLQTEPEQKVFENIPIVEKEKIPDAELKEEIKPKKLENEIRTQPFPNEKPREKTRTSGEIQISQQFEKALSSAIEKKQIKTKQEPAGMQEEIKEEKNKELRTQPDLKIEQRKSPVEIGQIKEKKKITVRCPQCKVTFPVEREEGIITKIKCQNCGKEGVIK